MKRIATTFARLVGVAMMLYSSFVFVANIAAAISGATYDPAWGLLLVLVLGGTGMIGAVIFLLSLDGPPRYRTRGRRFLGWIGMLSCSLLPSFFLFFIAPLVIVGGLTLLLPPELPARRRGRHLATSS